MTPRATTSRKQEKSMRKKILITLLGGLLGAPAMAAESYTVDPRHTYPMYEVDHWGWSLQRGRFTKTSGKITLDREAKTGTVDVTISAASVSTGLDKWDEQMRSEEWFDAEKHPEITFKAAKIVFNGDKPASVPGELTIRGVTRPATLEVARFGCRPNPVNKKEVCGADTSTVIKRSEFGILKYLPGIADEVRLLVSVEAFKD
jgi:polyisoprenoid-binding protein YceI